MVPCKAHPSFVGQLIEPEVRLKSNLCLWSRQIESILCIGSSKLERLKQAPIAPQLVRGLTHPVYGIMHAPRTNRNPFAIPQSIQSYECIGRISWKSRPMWGTLNILRYYQPAVRWEREASSSSTILLKEGLNLICDGIIVARVHYLRQQSGLVCVAN